MKKRKSKTEWIYNGQKFRVGETYDKNKNTEQYKIPYTYIDKITNTEKTVILEYPLVVVFQRLYYIYHNPCFGYIGLTDIMTGNSFWLPESRVCCIEKLYN